MKNEALFSSKNKKLKCRLLQFLFGTLRVKNKPYLLSVLLLAEAKKRYSITFQALLNIVRVFWLSIALLVCRKIPET